jgi:hypothetical protein
MRRRRGCRFRRERIGVRRNACVHAHQHVSGWRNVARQRREVEAEPSDAVDAATARGAHGCVRFGLLARGVAQCVVGEAIELLLIEMSGHRFNRS